MWTGSNIPQPYDVPISAASISCPITVVPASDGPTKPVVTAGACTVGTTFTVSFTSTDPNGGQLRYGIDWDADGTIDQFAPSSGYVNSGTTLTASRTYSLSGQKQIQVVAINDQGAQSPWTTYSPSICACPAGYTLQGNSCVLANQCATPPHCSGNDLINSCTGATIQTCSLGCASGACNTAPAPSATLNATPSLVHSGDISTISWSAINVASCAVRGTNGDSWTGTSSSGKTSQPILAQTIYTLHCIGVSGSNPSSIDKQAIVNIVPQFNEK